MKRLGGLLALALAWGGCVAAGVVEERPTPPVVIDGGPVLVEPSGTNSSPDAVCENRCSADLRSIDDCRGRVVQACSPDEGCSNGTCVPACAAAEAAQGTLGCEFYVAPVAFQKWFNGQNSEACVAAMIANGGRAPVSVSISHLGAPIDLAGKGRLPRAQAGVVEYAPLPEDGKIPSDGIAIFFLQETTAGACPAPALVTGPMLRGTGFGDAFRIETSHPVSAFSVLPALTASTTLALLYPAASWGRSYVAAVSEPADAERAGTHLLDEETGLLVVAKEETTVIVTPSSDLVGKPDAGVRSVAAGESRHFTLAAGTTLQLVQRENLSGTVVTSDKPIGLLTGSSWYQQTSRHQQFPPVRATGHRYAAVRPRNREAPFVEKHGWRFVGMVDGTKLTYHPSPPVDAPTEIKRGEVIEIETAERFVVESQDADHPFALLEGTRRPIGSPFDTVLFESVPAVSLDQFVSTQLLYTVPGFKVGHLVVVREADADGTFHAVELDCLGDVTGWETIDESGRYQYALIDTPRFDYEKKTSYCDLGRRTMRSDAPFGVTVWGWLGAETYAYPAATGLRVVNNVNVGVQ